MHGINNIKKKVWRKYTTLGEEDNFISCISPFEYDIILSLSIPNIRDVIIKLLSKGEISLGQIVQSGDHYEKMEVVMRYVGANLECE